MTQKVANLEHEKTELEEKNAALDEENQDLAKKILVMTQDIKKLNTLISKNLEDFMNNHHEEKEEKRKRKYSKSKKENNTKLSHKDSTDEKPRSSPIRTRKKPERKLYPSEEQKTPNKTATETEENEDDEEEDDFEINISDASSEEGQEEFYTPKKGKRKAAVPKKPAAVAGKKIKKNEIKESVAQSRNMIQYQLFA